MTAELRPRWSACLPSPENYARRWCSVLTDPAGAFSSCHSVISPGPFHSVRPPASPWVGWGAGGRTCPTPGSLSQHRPHLRGRGAFHSRDMATAGVFGAWGGCTKGPQTGGADSRRHLPTAQVLEPEG